MKLLLIASLLITVSCRKLEISDNVDPLSDEMINAINALATSWTAGRNFGKNDLNRVIKMLGVKKDASDVKLPVLIHQVPDDIPVEFDARKAWPKCKTISQIRDQGMCGSCWAFGAVESMSDRYCIASGGALNNLDISAEDLISCCQGFFSCGNGCDGGKPGAAWRYWVSNGIVSGGTYNSSTGCRPYTIDACAHGVPGSKYPPCGKMADTPDCTKTCAATYSGDYSGDLHFGAKAYSIDSANVQQIQTEIMTNGPVEADFQVYADFVHYKSGVYVKSSSQFLGSHAIRILGWGREDNVDYWLCANSWNEYWGESGFFKIRRGTNECEIEEDINAGTPKL